MIYTSYFSNIKRIRGRDGKTVLVSIAGSTPEWLPEWFVVRYRKLMPKKAWWDEWRRRFMYRPDSAESVRFYVTRFDETVLKRLDPKDVADELVSMCGSGGDVFLLCYEPPEGFCHRKLVSKWLNSAGIECSEWIDRDTERKD